MDDSTAPAQDDSELYRERSYPPVNPNSNFKHYCRYVIIKKTIKDKANGQSYIERCRCMRSIYVDYKLFVDGYDTPRITKHWYDRNGNLEKVTGYQDNKMKAL